MSARLADQQDVEVGGNDRTDREQVDDVEEKCTPEHLLGRSRDSLGRVLGGFGFSWKQTDQLGPIEGEGSVDEYRADLNTGQNPGHAPLNA